jgi:hypothetical protein
MAPKKKSAPNKRPTDGGPSNSLGRRKRGTQQGGINPGIASATWVSSTYRIIHTVVGGNTFEDFKLDSNAPFKTYLGTAGEYRLRRLRAVWQPLSSDPRSGTIIAHPYFDDANAGSSIADLFAAGNRTRPVSSSFSTTIQYRQEAQLSTQPVQGGLTWFWATTLSATSAPPIATVTPGVWTIWIDLDQRGLKPVSAVTVTPVIPQP